jgi:hypothetical protein
MPGKHFDLDELGLDKSEFDEAVRVLMADGNIVVIDPEVIGEPFILGMLCVDIMKHGARAFARQAGMDETAAFQTILSGLMAELQNPTDEAGEAN